jgi:Excalibur calcium-binding domain
MRNLITAIAIAGLAWYGYTRHQERAHTNQTSSVAESASPFSCDGRKHCSEMTSCEEATYFLEHCPNTRMDGDNDGVPCEKQWCQ